LTLELKVPPAAVFVIVLAVMRGAAALVPAAEFSLHHAGRFAALAAVVGIAIGIAGIIAFRRHGTTVHPMRPETASAVVDTGIYGHSRNPMYLGLSVLLAAWGLWLANGAALAMVPVFVAYLTRFQILPEERAMLGNFGEQYAGYMARVRRWL
jgi:protein-S-isoprenylcysteine O-methyltransferase Ste14